MNCSMFREMIFNYTAGELDADSLADFRGHYETCGPCGTALKTIEAQEEILVSLPRPKAPDALWRRVRAEIESRVLLRRLERPSRYAGRWLAGAAALLMAAAALWALARPQPREELPFRVVDVPSGGGALGRMIPGYENPDPTSAVSDGLLGMSP
ncbi:MAG: zf-HC2 domain-containing protein [Planctomycetes bacterium]|nr:zf-HC2 domain-containing protein [Planctomycetota bacterium]